MRYQNLIPQKNEEKAEAIDDEGERAAVELVKEPVTIKETASGLQVVEIPPPADTGHYL